jgi:Putative zinc-finger
VPQSAKADLPAGTSIHLDADELSAYAENALPIATRARYTAHLVDCDDCRKIVSQLSVATGPPAEARVASDETIVSKWSEKLAALLSPRMLRYAMPALVLCAVIAVGFFMLRQQKEASLVAQSGSAENSREAAPQVESKQLATSPAQGAPKTPGNEEQAGSQKHAKATSETNSKTSERAAGSAGAAATPTAAPPKDKESSKNEAVATARPSYAPEPSPSAKPTTETARAETAKVADESREKEEAAARKKEADKTGAFAVTASKDAPASPQTGSAQASARKAKAAPSNGRLMGGVAGGVRSDDQSEIRTIAGRRFRRQNGAWVDTAYDSSQSTTNVARGSDQYRALIADEPDIRTIAEQLSGQVIVVWKGHAYRIH